MKKVTTAIIIIVAMVAGFYMGIKWNQFQYDDLCLDMGGGKNPGNYPICVIEKTINNEKYRQEFDVCDENGKRYKSAEDARHVGLKDEDFGATYCPEYKMDPSWDINKDGVNDCYDDNSCNSNSDYMLPRPKDIESEQKFPGFSIKVILTTKAKETIISQRESIVASCMIDGGGKDGEIYSFRKEIYLPADTFNLNDIKIPNKVKQTIDNDKKYKLLINVISGRKTNKNNLLSCDSPNVDIDTIFNKMITINCKTIGE